MGANGVVVKFDRCKTAMVDFLPLKSHFFSLSAKLETESTFVIYVISTIRDMHFVAVV
jgi:hypothetical protein